MGVEKNNSSVPISKSRSKGCAMNTVTMNSPITLNEAKKFTITVGALRCTLPMAPPIWIASELVAPKANSANTNPATHSSGARTWYRRSKRKNSASIVQPMEVHVFQVGSHGGKAFFGTAFIVDMNER